jgi:hypothetical protein
VLQVIVPPTALAPGKAAEEVTFTVAVSRQVVPETDVVTIRLYMPGPVTVWVVAVPRVVQVAFVHRYVAPEEVVDPVLLSVRLGMAQLICGTAGILATEGIMTTLNVRMVSQVLL